MFEKKYKCLWCIFQELLPNMMWSLVCKDPGLCFFFFKHIYLWIVYHCCVLVFSDYWEGKKPSLAWVKYLNTISFIYPQFPFFFSSFLTNNYLGVWFYFVHACMHAKLFQPCLTLCHPTDCTLPGFSVHGILQVRIWDWVAVPSSKGSSRPRNWTHVSYI